MEHKFRTLKNDFKIITDIRFDITNTIYLLHNKIQKMNSFYSEFIRNNKSQIFIFGLDSFRFQSKLIVIEYDDMKRMFLSISNRMYCEYFKLYKLIVSYINENINDTKINEHINGLNFPVYKDLEPFKDYDLKILLDIHENIIILLDNIYVNMNKKEKDLLVHKTKQCSGFNIDNFVSSFNHNIVMIKENLSLFITYIDFFHKTHKKYMTKLLNKIKLMLNDIDNDINLDLISKTDTIYNKLDDLDSSLDGSILDQDKNIVLTKNDLIDIKKVKTELILNPIVEILENKSIINDNYLKSSTIIETINDIIVTPITKNVDSYVKNNNTITDIISNETDIILNETDIILNETDTNENETDINENENEIGIIANENETGIIANENDIIACETGIIANETDINSHKKNR